MYSSARPNPRMAMTRPIGPKMGTIQTKMIALSARVMVISLRPCQRSTTVASIEFISLVKRPRIRPVGVLSKNRIGAWRM